MTNNEITVRYQRYTNKKELAEADNELCDLATEALKTSHSPYSNFKVGTAIRLKTGEIVLGSNQENVAYPSGLCAERVALFGIGARADNPVIESMAITAQTENFTIEHPVTSCGACLQVMADFETRQKSPIEILFYCIGGEVIKVDGVKQLMPLGFVEERLENG